MTVERIINAITLEREAKYSSKLFSKVLRRISDRYSSDLVEHYLVRIEKIYFEDKEFIRIRGSKAVFKTDRIETAFKIRNLLHSSGYKNSKVEARDSEFTVVAEAPDNIILSKYFIEKLREGDEYFVRLVSKFLKEIFLRNLKRIKLLLKNTKF